MIFWFRANDGMLSLIMLIVWVLSLTALVLLLFNEGVSFAESSRSSTKIPVSSSADTIYVLSEARVYSLVNDKTLPFNTDGYSMFINEEKNELYISPYLEIESGKEEPSGISVEKESFGNSEIVAFNRTKELLYNYRVAGDSVLLDDYFTIPPGRRWSGDNIKVKITLPEGTIIKTDPEIESLLDLNNDSGEDDNHYPREMKKGYSTWRITEDGLVPAISK